MQWFGIGPPATQARDLDARARERLLEQERRVQALDRVIEVIQRDLPEDRPHATP
jgi:hypothetical protein